MVACPVVVGMIAFRAALALVMEVAAYQTAYLVESPGPVERLAFPAYAEEAVVRLAASVVGIEGPLS